MRRVRMMTLHIDPALQWGLALSVLAIMTAWMVFVRPVNDAQPVFAPSAGSTTVSFESPHSMVRWPDVLRLGLPTVRMTETTARGFTLRTLQSLFYAITRIQITDPRTFLAAQIPVLATAPEPQPAVWTPPSRSPQVFSPIPSFSSPTEGDLSPLPAETVKPPEPKKPSIFIYHSHNAEAYGGKQDYIYNDDNLTIMRVGQELTKELNRLGVNTVQNGTHHMDLKFTDAYMNSRRTVQAALKDNPEYKMVFDIHRDGDIDLPVTTTVINNEPVARILIVLSNTTGLSHPNWRQNEAFAKELNKKLEELYPSLSRGIRYDDVARFNQDLHPRSLLLEIGGDLNSIDEALRSVRYLAKVLAEMSK
ncbi:MAG: stage II sporulation protein P [Bacillota bacterium]